MTEPTTLGRLGRPLGTRQSLQSDPELQAQLAAPPKPPENPLAAAYTTWKATPTPQAASEVLRAANPVISSAIRSFAGGVESPLTRSKAKQLILDALPNYDPERAQLQTYLMHHLQRLQRLAPREAQAIPLPEQMLAQRKQLNAVEVELLDELGRPPTTAELADRTGLSLRRIAQIRRTHSGVPESQLLGGLAGDDEEGNDPAVARDTSLQAAEFVYDSLDDPIDRIILERLIGLHGTKVMPVGGLAKLLKLSPSAISQRAARLQQQLDDVDQLELF